MVNIIAQKKSISTKTNCVLFCFLVCTELESEKKTTKNDPKEKLRRSQPKELILHYKKRKETNKNEGVSGG